MTRRLPRPDQDRLAYLEHVNALARGYAAEKDSRATRCPRGQRGARAETLYRQGASIPEVAEALGVHVDTARRIRSGLLSQGVDLPPLREPQSVEDRQALALLDEGLSYAQIGAELDWSKSKVARVLRRAKDRAAAEPAADRAAG